MSIHRLFVLILLSLALCAGAIAKEELPPVKVHHEAGVDYVYGGMDPLERKAIGKLAERFQVQLAFSREGTNEKLSGVKVTMIDYKGDKAVEKVIDGPIFFANPPAGRWTLQAQYGDEKFSKTVDVNGRFFITLNVQFKGEGQGSGQGN
jgi:hypothetical protein